MRWHTILYVRKSTEEDDRQTLSLDAQENECRAYARRQALQISEVIREAHSARKPGRPRFDAMVKRIERLRRQDVRVRILCHKPDRLLRNIADWARINDLVEAGIELVFVTGSYPNNAQGKMAFGINVVFAKYYVDNLSEEVRKGQREKLARGEWPGWAPLGYLNIYRKIEIDPGVAPLIRRAFDLCATGDYSLMRLTQELARAGLVGRWGGKPLTKSILRDRILTNPFYCGLMRYGGELYLGSHQPLISKALFDRVQEVLGGRSRPRRSRHSFRYGGLLQCDYCGCAVVGDIKKERYVYYRCGHRRGPCPSRYLREEALGKRIAERVATVLMLPESVADQLRQAAARLVKEQQASVDDHRPALEKRLRDLEQRQQTLLDLRLGGHISEAEFVAKRDDLTAQQAELRERGAAFEPPSIDPREAVDRFIRTCNDASVVLQSGKDAHVRELLRIVGSNYRLRDGIIDFTPVKPFDLAAQARNRPNWRGEWDEVLTQVMRNQVGSLRTDGRQN